MAMSYMEMIYIDGSDARHTGVGAAFATNAETWAQFKECQKLEVPRDNATFLLDYYNAKGDLAGTIFLDDATYAHIANEPVLSAAAYRKIDRDYWAAAVQRRDAERNAPATVAA